MKSVYSKRRDAFRAKLKDEVAGRRAVAVFLSGEPGGLDAFEPDPTFYYLTGVEEPRAALAFFVGPQKATEQLFLPEADPANERWNGKTLCAGGLTPSAEPDDLRRRASEATGVEAVAPYYQLEAALVRPLRDADLLYLDFPGEAAPLGLSHALSERLRSRYPYLEVRHGGRLAAELRRVKDAEELRRMRRACDVACEAQRAVTRTLAPGLHEYEVRAVVEYVFASSGARRPAFPSIIGSGPRSCVLHYERNDRRMRAGDLVVCDIGCRLDQYCSDVTRTYPVSGRFTKRQARVYDVVLAAHDAALAAAKPGAFVRDVHQAAAAVIEKAGFAKYFFHGTSHYLGLEAHDVGSYDLPLEPGVVITIEPGIYIADENLGVRIEDDVVVTAAGCERLTRCPTERAAIEKALSRSRKKIVI
jgi:Xaa-Pro aminopeptidase